MKSITVPLIMQDHYVTGLYRGGEYIDLFLGSRTKAAPAFAVINVWDYKEGKPLIPFTRGAVAQAMKDYRRELFPHEIEQYAPIHWTKP